MNLEKQFKQVTEFNEAFGLPIQVENTEAEQIDLGRKLLLEELEEYREGLLNYFKAKNKEEKDNALIEIFDALIDLKYVLIGRCVYQRDLGELDPVPLIPNNSMNSLDKDYCLLLSNYLEEDINGYIKESIYSLDEINDSIDMLIANHYMIYVFQEGFNEVHRSNMSKLENGKVLLREDGKVLKGKDYFKPNLRPVLFK